MLLLLSLYNRLNFITTTIAFGYDGRARVQDSLTLSSGVRRFQHHDNFAAQNLNYDLLDDDDDDDVNSIGLCTRW